MHPPTPTAMVFYKMNSAMLVAKGLELLACSRANFSSISSLESVESSLSSSVDKQVEGEKAAVTGVFIYSAHVPDEDPLWILSSAVTIQTWLLMML